MRTIDTSTLSKEIHFPVTRAVYTKPPKRNWFQKLLKFVVYRRRFELMKDYVLWSPSLKRYTFTPDTFIYDGASVPKFLNGIFNTNGMLLLGSLPHDFGYRYECLILVDELTGELCPTRFTKKELDSVFKDLCSWESGFTTAASVATSALTLFGFIGWRSNRKLNKNLYNDFPGLFAEKELCRIEEL